MSEDLAERLVDGLASLGGGHPGARWAHAKGVLCHATFRPTAAAAELSRADHFAGPEVRAHVRFSNGSGNPNRHDAARDARGMSVKFYLSEGTTDLVLLNLPVYFSRTPEDQLAFNAARELDPETGEPDLARVGAYLAEHPETVPAVTAVVSMAVPSSYAAEIYNSLHAFRFVAGDGTVTHGRYRLSPATTPPAATSDDEERSRDFLREELEERFASGPVRYHVDLTLAGPDDDVNDPAAAWPEDRDVVRLGDLEITGFAFDRETGDDVLVFDPTRVPDGIELTDDPILRIRRDAYSISVARRTGTSLP